MRRFAKPNWWTSGGPLMGPEALLSKVRDKCRCRNYMPACLGRFYVVAAIVWGKGSGCLR
jgi:hypothetical protein